MRSIRNLLIALFFTSTFTIYVQIRFGGGGKNVQEENFQQHSMEERKGSGNEAVLIKNIVAYSLGKKLEMEGRYENCTANENVIKEVEEQKKKRMWRKLPGNDVFIYSSYLDERLRKEGTDYIRTLALIKTGIQNDTNASTTSFYCNLVTDGTEHTLKSTPSITEEIWSDNWKDNDQANNYKPLLISCQLPKHWQHNTLYLSKRKCSTNISIHISNNRIEVKDDFRICVKPLDFKQDVSLRLIKWIEMNFILGINKIIFYVYSVHKNVYKVLNYYRKLGRIDFIKTKPLKEMNIQNIWQKRKLEILYYNDCFYQNLHSTKYIIPLDIDELIIPKQSYKLQNIVFPSNYSSHNVRNTYYFSTNYFDYYKSEYSAEGESGKSFISTENALTIFNHYALKTLRPGIQKVNFLSTDIVQMNHYKTTCDINILPECSKYRTKIYDDIMKKYKNELEMRISLIANKN